MNVEKMKEQLEKVFERGEPKAFILICSCFNMSKKASEAFSVLFPNLILPDIVKGKDRVYKLGKELRNDHILAISKLSGKFAYYVKVEGNKIVEEWNLLKGSRIA